MIEVLNACFDFLQTDVHDHFQKRRDQKRREEFSQLPNL